MEKYYINTKKNMSFNDWIEIIKFRYRFIYDHKKWIKPNKLQIDIDSVDYNNNTQHYTIYDNTGKLIAYVRGVVSNDIENCLINQKYFKNIFGENWTTIKNKMKNSTEKFVEISRYCIDPNISKEIKLEIVKLVMYIALIKIGYEQQIRYLLVESEQKMHEIYSENGIITDSKYTTNNDDLYALIYDTYKSKEPFMNNLIKTQFINKPIQPKL